jgi:hypothetical protein
MDGDRGGGGGVEPFRLRHGLYFARTTCLCKLTKGGTVTFFIQTFFIRNKVYTNFLYTGQILYGTKFIQDKVYTGTKFIRGQSLYGDKVYTGQSLYGDKVYTRIKFIQTFFILHLCSTTGKPTRSFATERVSLDSV